MLNQAATGECAAGASYWMSASVMTRARPNHSGGATAVTEQFHPDQPGLVGIRAVAIGPKLIAGQRAVLQRLACAT